MAVEPINPTGSTSPEAQKPPSAELLRQLQQLRAQIEGLEKTLDALSSLQSSQLQKKLREANKAAAAPATEAAATGAAKTTPAPAPEAPPTTPSQPPKTTPAKKPPKISPEEESLQDALRRAIKSYMANQEHLLRNLSNALSFLILGGQDSNDILNALSSLSTASSDFNLNNSLVPDPNVGGPNAGSFFKGDKATIEKRIQDESKAAQNDIDGIDAALKKIAEQEKDVDAKVKNGSLTQQQADQIDKKLFDKKNSLITARANLVKLKNLLDSLVVIGPGQIPGVPSGDVLILEKLPNGNEVPGWQSQLGDLEGALLKGPDSLTSIYTDIQNTGSDFSSQTQTQQMQTQLVMTEIQQEWTIVTTSLQLVNQSATTILSGIQTR